MPVRGNENILRLQVAVHIAGSVDALHAQENLGQDEPSVIDGDLGVSGGVRSYVSDPSNPVPYEGGTLGRRSRSYMHADQR